MLIYLWWQKITYILFFFASTWLLLHLNMSMSMSLNWLFCLQCTFFFSYYLCNPMCWFVLAVLWPTIDFLVIRRYFIYFVWFILIEMWKETINFIMFSVTISILLLCCCCCCYSSGGEVISAQAGDSNWEAACSSDWRFFTRRA